MWVIYIIVNLHVLLSFGIEEVTLKWVNPIIKHFCGILKAIENMTSGSQTDNGTSSIRVTGTPVSGSTKLYKVHICYQNPTKVHNQFIMRKWNENVENAVIIWSMLLVKGLFSHQNGMQFKSSAGSTGNHT